MTYLLYLFGFLPSIIWLIFYLRKDAHPESNKMILKIFFLGMLGAILAIFLEKGFQKASFLLTASPNVDSILVLFLGGALIEEYIKYLVVRVGVFGTSELDEPPDLLLYMIISALGFASLENILVLTNYHPILNVAKVLEVVTYRFVSATFLHALCSGILGYFLAVSLLYPKKRIKMFFIGLGAATFLHGLYNCSIMKVGGMLKFVLPLLILIGLSSFVSFEFRKLKRLKGICHIA